MCRDGMSYPAIGKYFNRHYTTIMHHVKKSGATLPIIKHSNALDHKTIAQIVKLRREGMSQETIANKLGLARQTVMKYCKLRKVVPPTPEELRERIKAKYEAKRRLALQKEMDSKQEDTNNGKDYALYMEHNQKYADFRYFNRFIKDPRFHLPRNKEEHYQLKMRR